MKSLLMRAAGLSSLVVLWGCPVGSSGPSLDYRAEMRSFVQNLSAYAKTSSPSFAVIPQNGGELLTLGEEADSEPAAAYLAAIDGVGREDLNYGYETDGQPTPAADRDYMHGWLDLARDSGKRVLVIDYPWTSGQSASDATAAVDASLAASLTRGYVGTVAPRELDSIPNYPSPIHAVHTGSVTNLGQVQNFLFLGNPEAWATGTGDGGKANYLAALAATNYDLLIIDPFFPDASGTPRMLTSAEVSSLKTKANSGSRLVVSYLSIGEAEDYRDYWKSSWDSSPPIWLGPENPDWPGNYKVRYWIPAWQAIIFGSAESSLDRILAAGFDGAYLDIIDAFEYWE